MTPTYRTPADPGYIGRIGRRARLWTWLAILIAHWLITESVALRFLLAGFRPPGYLFTSLDLAVYWPWTWLVWEWRLDIQPTLSFASHFQRYQIPDAVWFLRAGALIVIILSFVLLHFVPRIVLTSHTEFYSRNQEDLHGSSHWADARELRDAGVLHQRPADHRGIILGLWAPDGEERLQYLRDDSDRHVLVVAPTGTGKTASCVIQTALDYPHSTVIYDPKGELWDSTAGHRQQQGHKCIRLAPADPEHSAHYNPLDFIRLHTRFEVPDAQNFAHFLCAPGNEVTNNSHWDLVAEHIIAGLILHMMYYCEVVYCRPATMVDVSAALSPYITNDDGCIGSLQFKAYLLTVIQFRHNPDLTRGWTLQDGTPTATHPFIMDKALEALSRYGGHDGEANSVLSAAKKRFSLFSDPNVAEVTSSSDFSIADLVHGDRTVSLYFVSPLSDMERLAPLTQILVATIFNRLTKEAEERHPLLFLLDEFTTLGYIRPLAKGLSFARSFGIRFMLIVQDLSQIATLYGRQNEIVPNCQLQIYFPIADLATAKAVSDTLGSTTVSIGSFNISGPPKALLDGKGVTGHTHHIGRPLLQPSELMVGLRLPRKEGARVVAPGEFVILIFGHRPARGVQCFWFFDPVIARRVGCPITQISAPSTTVEQELRSVQIP